MAIKLIALDMDGTTLNDNHITISSKNRKAISFALDNGIIVVPATGRTLNKLPHAIRKVSNIRYVITSNGASVVDLKSDKTIYSNLIPQKAAIEVLKIITDCRVYAEVYYAGKAYVERGVPSNLQYRSMTLKFYSLFLRHEKVDSLVGFVEKNGDAIEKIELLPDNISKKDDLERKLKGMPVSITTSGMNSIEINNYQTNKGAALEWLCKYLSIKADEVMAIGDNFNDLEMLKWAGIGVAVKNANPVVKSAADFVTLSSNCSGVAYAIRHFVKQQKA